MLRVVIASATYPERGINSFKTLTAFFRQCLPFSERMKPGGMEKSYFNGLVFRSLLILIYCAMYCKYRKDFRNMLPNELGSSLHASAESCFPGLSILFTMSGHDEG